jgi:tight adherence protein B
VLRENGHAVANFQAVNLGQTKSIVLALDRSQSMRGRPLANALAAGRQFANTAGGDDHVGVVAFGHSAIALTRVGSSPSEAADQIGGMTVDSQSGTALYDAIVVAANRLGQDARPGRAIVVVTDGADVSSSHSLKDAVAAAHAAHAAIYAIGIAGPDFTASALQELASDTGGSYRQASSARDLTRTYAALQDELSRTWQLTYLTTARPGENVSLTAKSHGSVARWTHVLPGSGSAPQLSTGVLPSAVYGPTGTFALAVAVGCLMLLACWFWFASQFEGRLKRRIEPHIPGEAPGAKGARRKASREATQTRLVDMIENAFANVKQFKRLERLIERADMPLRPGELLGISVGSALLAAFVFGLAGLSTIFVLFLMGFAFAAPIAWVSWKARGRLRRFENQLPDLLITVAASLKAGHSFRQGVQSVVEEGAEPAANEFKRVLTETQLGKPMDDALLHMAERIGSSDFGFVITAVTIQRQIGGSLAGLFDMIAETVRQRQQFARKVRSLTAMGRLSAYVLVGLPFFMAGAVTLMNPTYMAPLWHSSTGHLMVTVGLIMIGSGSLMLKKIASFRG